jgi:serine/threonine-protein kinase RsbW
MKVILEKNGPSSKSSQFILAIDELCTNAIEHQGNGESMCNLSIKLTRSLNHYAAEITYSGKEFNLNSYDSLEIDELREIGRKGGLGIRFIKNIVDDIEYQYHDNVNKYVLTKKL